MNVKVDHNKCAEVATLLRRITIPPPEEEGDLEELSSGELPNFYFLLVAICHQTSPIGKLRLGGVLSSGTSCEGWDYLRKRLAERVSKQPLIVDPRKWRVMTADFLDDLLADETGSRTFTATDRRAELIRDLGDRFLALGITRVEELHTQCAGWLLGGPAKGLLTQLQSFVAYADPVKKKSYYFLQLMRGVCGWTYKDLQNLGAPVDYHEVRGHLRLGTVIIEKASLREKIQQKVDVDGEEDISIRRAVCDAISLISEQLVTTSPATLHYLLWNAFRNCCGRDKQHCAECSTSCLLPYRYRDAFAPVESRKCVFASICPSASRPDKLIEHQHPTTYY